jgi:hypothetical protein
LAIISALLPYLANNSASKIISKVGEKTVATITKSCQNYFPSFSENINEIFKKCTAGQCTQQLFATSMPTRLKLPVFSLSFYSCVSEHKDLDS